ncbi:LuxR C-terminal-related transcriptional regulator [Gymnodinialimonas sp. 2305UL16-5]|uniref:helix-turn-helix transcriptional regulator n=1 Tax=Gymnodinialimonas mytili TaxID=3126503 RepID=UPI0030B1728F
MDLIMLLDRAIEFDRIETFDQAWQFFQDSLSPLGFANFIYLTINGDWTGVSLSTNVPELYEQADPAEDPFLSHCCHSYKITLTGPAYLPDYAYLPEPAQRFIQKARGVGFETGFGIPMRLKGSERFGGFNIGTGASRADFEASLLDRREELRAFCLLAHRRLESLTQFPSSVAPEDDLALSPDIVALEVLSDRERDVAFFIAQGLSRKQCAQACGISPHTVSEYVKSIYKKLGINDRILLVRMFMEAGVDLPRSDAPLPK